MVYHAPMPILVRYTLRQLAAPTLLALVAFAGAVWLSQSLRFVDLIVNKGLSVGRFLYLTSLLVPSLLLVVLPFAAFIGSLMGYHRLRGESELSIFRATGLSDLQIARGAMALGVAFLALSYLVGLYVMPVAYRHFRDLQFDIRQNVSNVTIQERVFTAVGDGLTIYVDERLGAGELGGIIVHDTRRSDRNVTLVADRGRIVGGEGGPVLRVEDGSYQERDEGGGLSIVSFAETAIELVQPGEPAERGRKTRELFLPQLLQPPPELTPADRRERIAEAHERLAWPLVSLALPLIAATAVLKHRAVRDTAWKALAVAAVIAIAVVVLSLVAVSFAKSDLRCVPLLYAVPLVPTILSLIILARGPADVTRRAAAT